MFLFDIPDMGADQRDKRMAENILSAIEESPKAVHLILTGNVHARTSSERWMSWHILKRHKNMISLNISCSGGSAWLYTSEGRGPTKLRGKDRGQQQFIERFTEPDGHGYNGRFYLGPINASPPAVSSGSPTRTKK